MTFPTNLSNYTGNETMLAAEHAQEHNALEAKVGIDGSAVTTSHDYKLSGVTGTDKAVSKTGTETLTNKTLTSPVVNTPTGIVKGDVGLGNVDNTSDATKNAAAVTLTNKTLTSPVINTGISGTAKATAAEVATGTDDTKIVTPLAATGIDTRTATFTNKTLTSPKINENVALTATATELNTLDNSVPRKSGIFGSSMATEYAAGSTAYVGIGSTTNMWQTVLTIPCAGVLKNLYCFTSTAPTAGKTGVCTIMVQGSASIITCTIADTSNAASDLTHSVSVAAGNRIVLRFVTSAGAATMGIVWGLEFDAS